MVETVSETLDEVMETASVLHDWEREGRPKLMNRALNRWPAVRNWTGVRGTSRLLELTGDASVEVMCSPTAVFDGAIGKHVTMQCSMKEFLDEANQERWMEMGMHTYLAQASILDGTLQALLVDVPLPDAFTKSDLHMHLWMSHKWGCRSSPHYDPYQNLLCLLKGSKSVRLCPPSMTDRFYPYPVWSESYNHCMVRFQEPDFEGGDVLFIPEGWWHQVDSDRHTIATNIWWTSDATREAMEGSKSVFYFRLTVRSMIEDEIRSMVRKVQPIDDFDEEIHGNGQLSAESSDTARSLPEGAVVKRRRPNKDPSPMVPPSVLSPGEQKGLQYLRHLLQEIPVTSSLSASIDHPLIRWLCSFSSSSVCRILLHMTDHDIPSLKILWTTCLTPMTAHLLTDHLQSYAASPDFYQSLFRQLESKEQEKFSILFLRIFVSTGTGNASSSLRRIASRGMPSRLAASLSVCRLRGPLSRRGFRSQRLKPNRRRHPPLSALDMGRMLETMPVWTPDQIAGLLFGFLLIGLYFSAGWVDTYIARIQRSELGLCEKCGGLYDKDTCSKPGCPLK